MATMEQVLTLYQHMADRCEESGVSPNQARVYYETIAFMRNCETVDEAMAKIKDSEYYLAPSVALVEDKIEALCKVAKENEMDEVVKVYEKKLEEIKKDASAIYDSTFYTTAHNFKTRYIQTKEAFCKIYEHYMRSCICSANDEVEINSVIKDMKETFQNFDLPSKDFLTLSELKSFRELITISDSEYAKFVETAILIREKGFEYKNELQKVTEEVKAAWDEVRALKDEIKQTGKHNASLSRWANVVVVAPDYPQKEYSYIDEEVSE